MKGRMKGRAAKFPLKFLIADSHFSLSSFDHQPQPACVFFVFLALLFAFDINLIPASLIREAGLMFRPYLGNMPGLKGTAHGDGAHGSPDVSPLSSPAGSVGKGFSVSDDEEHDMNRSRFSHFPPPTREQLYGNPSTGPHRQEIPTGKDLYGEPSTGPHNKGGHQDRQEIPTRKQLYGRPQHGGASNPPIIKRKPVPNSLSGPAQVPDAHGPHSPHERGRSLSHNQIEIPQISRRTSYEGSDYGDPASWAPWDPAACSPADVSGSRRSGVKSSHSESPRRHSQASSASHGQHHLTHGHRAHRDPEVLVREELNEGIVHPQPLNIKHHAHLVCSSFSPIFGPSSSLNHSTLSCLNML